MLYFAFVLPVLMIVVMGLLGFAWGRALVTSNPDWYDPVEARAATGIATLAGLYVGCLIDFAWYFLS